MGCQEHHLLSFSFLQTYIENAHLYSFGLRNKLFGLRTFYGINSENLTIEPIYGMAVIVLQYN